MKKRSWQPRRACTPLFSPEDADLAAYAWRSDRGGYARRASASRTFVAHRMVLARAIGRPLTPEDVCDHVNGDRLDNRRTNLRLTTRAGNSQHRRARNPTGLRGVTFHRQCGKWQAAVAHAGRSYYLGLYDTPEAAGEAAARKRASLGFLGAPNSDIEVAP